MIRYYKGEKITVKDFEALGFKREEVAGLRGIEFLAAIEEVKKKSRRWFLPTPLLLTHIYFRSNALWTVSS